MSYGTPEWRDWVLPEEASRPFIERALDLGINFFDTADMYSLGASEEVLGRAIRDFARRDEVVIATKVYFPVGDKPNDRGLSRKHILAAIDASLRRLGTDYVDLYQIHRWDGETPIEETLDALDSVVRAGKARYLGASSMYAWQLAKALYTADRHGWHRFVAMQDHYNLVYREEEREVLPLCREEGLGVIPWSPLARGLLTGNRKRGGERETTRAKSDAFADMYGRPEDFDVADRVAAVGRSRLAPPPAGRYRPDRRRHPHAAPGGRRRRRRPAPRRGRDRRARGALSPAPGARNVVVSKTALPSSTFRRLRWLAGSS